MLHVAKIMSGKDAEERSGLTYIGQCHDDHFRVSAMLHELVQDFLPSQVFQTMIYFRSIYHSMSICRENEFLSTV